MLAAVVADSDAKDVARAVRPGRGTTIPRLVIAAVLTAVATWLWVFPPAFLDPPSAPAMDAARLEAGLRFGVALQTERVRAHRAEVRRLPDLLREVEDTLPGILYNRVNASTFIIRARAGETLVEYDSSTPLDGFLGDALQRLADGP